jgi:hypothetical protein
MVNVIALEAPIGASFIIVSPMLNSICEILLMNTTTSATVSLLMAAREKQNNNENIPIYKQFMALAG